MSKLAIMLLGKKPDQDRPAGKGKGKPRRVSQAIADALYEAQEAGDRDAYRKAVDQLMRAKGGGEE